MGREMYTWCGCVLQWVDSCFYPLVVLQSTYNGTEVRGEEKWDFFPVGEGGGQKVPLKNIGIILEGKKGNISSLYKDPKHSVVGRFWPKVIPAVHNLLLL